MPHRERSRESDGAGSFAASCSTRHARRAAASARATPPPIPAAMRRDRVQGRAAIRDAESPDTGGRSRRLPSLVHACRQLLERAVADAGFSQLRLARGGQLIVPPWRALFATGDGVAFPTGADESFFVEP